MHFKYLPLRLIAFAIIFFAGSAFAQRFNYTNYSISNGLPNNHILKIVQDKKGYLWIGTINGVTVFDGFTFTKFEDKYALSNSPVESIVEDKSGNMWFGTSGKGLARYNGFSFDFFDRSKGLLSDNISGLCIAADGKLYIGSDNGLCIYDGKSFKSFTTKNGLPDNDIISVYAGKGNEVWVTTSGGFGKITDGKFKPYSLGSNPYDNVIFSMLIPEKGNIWLANLHTVFELKNDTFVKINFADEAVVKHLNCMFEDSKGNKWLGTRDFGLGLVSNQTIECMKKETGLSDNIVTALAEDHDGNIWVGTVNGLSKFAGTRFTIYSVTDGLSSDNINCIDIDSEGNFWAGTVIGGMVRLNNNYVKTYSFMEGLSSTSVNCIFIDNAKQLLCGTNAGIFKFDYKTNRFEQIFSDLKKETIYSITQSSTGTYYIGTNKGVFEINGQLSKVYNFESGLNNENVRSVYCDKEGIVWVGTLAGTYFIKQGKLYGIGKEKLPMAPVTSIIADNNDNIIFAIYDYGLYVYKRSGGGSFNKADSKENQINKRINCLHFNNDSLFIGNLSGFEIADWKKFIQQGQLITKSFDQSNGYLGKNTNGIKTDNEGNTWFANGNGLIKFNKHGIGPESTLPTVSIKAVKLFLNDVDWQKRGNKPDSKTGLPENLVLSNNENHVSFSFIAISFSTADEILYRFYLEGFDKDWSPATTHKIANYANLSPGTYTFKVQAKSNSSIWTEPSTYKFTIEESIWQTPIAWVVYILSGFFLLRFLFYLRTRNLQRSHNALARKVEERTREINVKNLELEKLSLVASKTDNAVMIFDKNLELEYVNHGFNKMTGYTLEEFITARGKKINEISFFDDFKNLLKHVLETKSSAQYESLMKRKNGEDLFASSNMTPIFDASNKLQYLLVIDTDITKLKKFEDQMQASLNERGILLKEIHHRVKNNLQIIISLFNLQSYYIKDEAALSALKEGQHRVRTLALIHERFYQSEGLSKIDFDDYMQRLAENLFLAYNMSKEKVKLIIQADKVALDIDTAVPCGLIINELISNAFKHAFNDIEQGELIVDFKETAPDFYTLIIKDNGKGLKDNFDIEKSDTLGMQLISALVDQIDGEYSFKNENGLLFKLAFKKVVD